VSVAPGRLPPPRWEAGAIIVNDVAAGADPDMFRVVVDAGAGLVGAHAGEPHMQHGRRTTTWSRSATSWRPDHPRVRRASTPCRCADPGSASARPRAQPRCSRLRELVDRSTSPCSSDLPQTSIAKLLGDDLAARDDGTLAAASGCRPGRIVRVHDVGVVADAPGCST
jgi:hypothetical protein